MIRKNKGFSLIEIMVVLIIIGMLAAGVATNFLGKADDAKLKQVKVDFVNIENALDLYKLDNFRYPTNEQGLEALVEKPAVEPVPRQWQTGGYLKGLPLDPWGNPYMYVTPGEKGAYDLYTFGADGRSGGEAFDADIFNWQRFENDKK